MGIEPTTYSLGSLDLLRRFKPLAAKLRKSALKQIKGIGTEYKTRGRLLIDSLQLLATGRSPPTACNEYYSAAGKRVGI
jgi:hypothetical protein